MELLYFLEKVIFSAGDKGDRRVKFKHQPLLPGARVAAL